LKETFGLKILQTKMWALGLVCHRVWEMSSIGTRSIALCFGGKKNDAGFTENDNVATSVVSQFKEGNTSEGISDLSGNVWEWTSSWYEKEFTTYTIRGGSWLNHRNLVRCVESDGDVPDVFNYVIGFRLVSPWL
jgi:formylglycine-generating enzyme required for sulfatase activity